MPNFCQICFQNGHSDDGVLCAGVWYMRPFRQFMKISERSKRADFISRIFFPFVFVMFNVVYWTLFTPGHDPNA